jgi:hypothetical protein
VEGNQRRTIGFALFGSSAVLLVIAWMISGGSFGLGEESRPTISMLLGGVGVLDAILGVYFILSAGRS